MPCIIITGYPSSGKTSIAEVLSKRALQHPSQSIKNTIIINEESIFSPSSSNHNPVPISSISTSNSNSHIVNETRYHCYKDSNAEKQTRSALKTEFDKHASTASSTKTLVILDSLNYIKGYRYELHCISKAFGERHAILWVICPPDLAMEWNRKRIREYEVTHNHLNQPSNLIEDKGKNHNDGQKDKDVPNHSTNYHLFYSNEMMEGLMKRYEPPDDRNRWDKPLYHVELSTLLPESTSSLSPNKKNNNDNPKCSQKNSTTEIHTTSVAKNVLEKSVYNMHSLSDVIGNDTTTSEQTKQYPYQKQSKINPAKANPQPSNLQNHNQNNLNPSEKDTRTPLEIRLDDILDAFLTSRPLKEGVSTQKAETASSNVLHEVDTIVKKITSLLVKAQQQVQPGGKISILPPNVNNKTISFPRRVNLPELRRLQRQYVKWVSSHPPDDTSEIGISNSYLAYLEAQI